MHAWHLGSGVYVQPCMTFLPTTSLICPLEQLQDTVVVVVHIFEDGIHFCWLSSRLWPSYMQTGVMPQCVHKPSHADQARVRQLG